MNVGEVVGAFVVGAAVGAADVGETDTKHLGLLHDAGQKSKTSGFVHPNPGS